MQYIETSAKSGENVEEAFLTFAKTLQQNAEVVKTKGFTS